MVNNQTLLLRIKLLQLLKTLYAVIVLFIIFQSFRETFKRFIKLFSKRIKFSIFKLKYLKSKRIKTVLGY